MNIVKIYVYRCYFFIKIRNNKIIFVVVFITIIKKLNINHFYNFISDSLIYFIDNFIIEKWLNFKNNCGKKDKFIYIYIYIYIYIK